MAYRRTEPHWVVWVAGLGTLAFLYWATRKPPAVRVYHNMYESMAAPAKGVWFGISNQDGTKPSTMQTTFLDPVAGVRSLIDLKPHNDIKTINLPTTSLDPATFNWAPGVTRWSQ